MRLEVFRTHGKIYEASASSMFNVPIKKIKKGNPEYALRAKGKVAELARVPRWYRSIDPDGSIKDGTYGRRTSGYRTPMEDSEQTDSGFLVYGRELCNRDGNTEQQTASSMITFMRDADYFTIKLPFGRCLFYPDPQIGENAWGNKSITYMGIDGTKKWQRLETYGGKLVENIVQAVARDLLANAIRNMLFGGYLINFHIHDEIIAEVPKGSI